MMTYSLCLVLIAVGLYGMIVKKNIVKMIVGLAIMEYGVNLLLVLIGYRTKGGAPVMDKNTPLAAFVSGSVDPLPQAMVLTSIVISLSVLILMVAICIRLYEKYGTFDITEMRKLKG